MKDRIQQFAYDIGMKGSIDKMWYSIRNIIDVKFSHNSIQAAARICILALVFRKKGIDTKVSTMNEHLLPSPIAATIKTHLINQCVDAVREDGPAKSLPIHYVMDVVKGMMTKNFKWDHYVMAVTGVFGPRKDYSKQLRDLMMSSQVIKCDW